MKKLLMIVMALAAGMAAWGDEAAFARASGASMRLDTRTGTRIAAKGASEAIAYSPKWGGAASCTVKADGTTLKTASAEGEVAWSPATTGAHTLTHTAGSVAYTAQFTVLGDDVTQHAGALAASETWASNTVHLVTADVTVPSGTTLTIEPGAVVKFMTGTSLTATGTCMANGVIFTHVNDDTAGGDTLMDGDAEKPVMDGYKLTGNLYEDDATEERYTAPQTLSSSISGTLRLKGHKVYLANSSITVNSGATLTLMPGAVIKFASGCSMTVNGTLDAQGTRAAPIVFTSDKDDEWGGDTNGDGNQTYAQAGDWYQIKVAGTANFNYCHVLYNASTENYGAVEAYGGTVNFDNSMIAHTKYECVNAHSSGTLTARNSVFRDSSLGFGYYGSGKVKAYNCVFADLTSGIRQSGKTLTNCIFYRCVAFTDQSGDGSSFKNCVFFNPSGFGAQSYSKCGSNGNIWADPLFLDPDNGDFRIAANSPCVDAGDGTVAPELDYYARPRMDARGKAATGVPNADGICPDIGIYEVQGAGVTPVADLAIVSVEGPGMAVPGEEIVVTYVVTNRGAVASGMVRDQVMLKGADAALGGQEIAAGVCNQVYGLEAGSAATFTARVRCPAVKSGNWKVGVTVNAERDVFEQVTANNKGWATEVTAIELQTLARGENSVTVAADTAKGFVVGEGVQVIRVEGSNELDRIAVYGANGAVPASADGGSAAVRLGDGSWLLVLPKVKMGEKGYVVIENNCGSGVTVKVTSETETFTLYGVAPSRVAAVDGVSVTITGTGLAEGQTVTLGGRTAMRVTEINSAQIVATFNLAGVAEGMAQVSVSGGSGGGGRTFPIEVYKTTQGPKLEAKLVLPSSVRDGRVYTAWVEYVNAGDEPMTMPIFKVERDDPSTKLGLAASATLTATKVFVGGISPNHPAGVLQPGDAGRIPVFFQPSGSYKLKLSHTKDAENPEYFKAFGGVKAYLAAMSAAATRINLRGRTEYRAHDFAEQALWEKNGVACAAVSGYLRDAITYEPLVNAAIGLVSTNAEEVASATGTTDSTGYFQLKNLPDGDYRWTVESGCTLVSTNIVKVMEQADVNEVDVLAQVGGLISGYVYGVDGQIVGGGQVQLLDALQQVVQTSSVDEAGYFVFKSIPEGVYDVVASAKGGYLTDVKTNVAISSLSRSETVEFKLLRGGRLTGVVHVGSLLATNGVVQVMAQNGISFEVDCQTNGVFVFEGMPPVEYSIRYYTDTLLSADMSVKLDVGAQKEISLQAETRALFFPRQSIGYGSLTTEFVFSDYNRMTNATSWAWDFDDDGIVDARTFQPTHTFTTVGKYTVRVSFTENGQTVESVYRDCVEVREPIETVYQDNVVVVGGKNGGTLSVISVGDSSLIVSGTPDIPLVKGTVLYDDSGNEPFARKVVSMSGSDSQLTVHTVDASITDVYRQFASAQLIRIDQEQPVLQSTLPRARLQAAANGNESEFKVIAEGGLRFEPILTKKIWLDFVPQVVNGEFSCHACVCVDSDIGIKLTADGEVGVQYSQKISFPCNDLKNMKHIGYGFLIYPDVNAGLEVRATGKGTVTESDYMTARLRLGFDWDASGFRWVPPFSRTLHSDFNGKLESLNLQAKLFFSPGFKFSWMRTLLSAGVSGEIACTASMTSGDECNPPKASIDYNVSIKEEVNWIDVDWPFFSWMGVKVNMIKPQQQNLFPPMEIMSVKGPIPDFLWQPGNPKPGESVTFVNQTLGTDVNWFGRHLEYEPTGWKWNINGLMRTDKAPTVQFPAEGSYPVSLKAKGYLLEGPNVCKKTVVVGKEEQEDDGEDDDDDGGGGETSKSHDPNEMAGPLGTGEPDTQRYVRPGEWMDYTIYFENKADAEVPAQEVFVDVQLSEYLDWSTFEMGEIAFNNQNEIVLAGLKNGQKIVAQDGADYKVQLSVEFDEKTGTAHWYLRSYDPNRSEYNYWPASDGAGFLPPNDESHRGEGHITYRVRVREDAPAGAVIDASATIVFDYNDPIETDPAWWNTVAGLAKITMNVDGQNIEKELIVGMPYGELPTPAPRSGYGFMGWYTGANGTGEKVTATSIVKAGVKALYAHWMSLGPTAAEISDPANVNYDPTSLMFVPPELYQNKAQNAFVGNAQYLGWVRDANGALKGTLLIKSAKEKKKDHTSKLSVSYTPLGGKKTTIKNLQPVNPVVGGNPVVVIPEVGTVTLGDDSFASAGNLVQVGQDFTKSKDKAVKARATSRLSGKVGNYTFALGLNGKYVGFTVAVDKKGKGKLVGVLPDGTKVSISSQGVLGDSALAIPFVYSKKGFFGFVFWVYDNGTLGVSDLTAFKNAAGQLQTLSWHGVSRTHELAAGSGRQIACAVDDGTVQTFSVANNKWTFPKKDANPCGWKMSYKAKDGSAKGQFTVLDANGKKVKYTVNGAVVGHTFYGTAYNKKAGSYSVVAE